MKNDYAGSDWIRESLHIENISELGGKVADLLGELFYGIYHLNHKASKRVNWSSKTCIVFILGYQALCTYDNDF